MFLFKKSFPAKTLALLLMRYTITGEKIPDDSGSFALGPHGISASDGSNVLPESAERTHWDHLSSRDSFIIALETMYLRGFVISISLTSFIKNKSIRDAVFSSYNDYWHGWTGKDTLDYQSLFEKACTIYGARILISDWKSVLEKRRDVKELLEPREDNCEDQEISKTVKEIGSEFTAMCDPFNIIRDPLRSELAKTGEDEFLTACEDVNHILETVLKKYKVTMK